MAGPRLARGGLPQPYAERIPFHDLSLSRSLREGFNSTGLAGNSSRVPPAGFCRLGFEIAPDGRKISGRKHEICFFKRMLATLPLKLTAMNFQKNVSKPAAAPATDSASLEIHSYLAARDLLLREVDANPTAANLRRASAANEFAEACLRPARSPYQAQSLPEAEASRERTRCNTVKLRLAQLRASLHRRAA